MANKDIEKVNYAPITTDLMASGGLGLLAGLFATITLQNLAVLNEPFLGVVISVPLILVGFIVICMVGILIGRFLSRFVNILYSFVKFGEAGGLNWLVDMGVVNLLILLTGFSAGWYFILFKAISFVAASTNSFFWNKKWVFLGSKKQNEGKEVGKFMIATTLGLLANVLVAGTINYFGPSFVGSINAAGWANIATISGSLFAMLFNFTLYKIWVFKA